MIVQRVKQASRPTKQEEDQRNDEKGTEYAAANIHENLRLGRTSTLRAILCLRVGALSHRYAFILFDWGQQPRLRSGASAAINAAALVQVFLFHYPQNGRAKSPKPMLFRELEHRSALIRTHRPTEVEPLSLLAIVGLEKSQLWKCLHPFAYYL
jgi:hypothetical protein